MADEIEEGGDAGATSPLPSQRDDEFRPFVRRLPEWQFWLVQLICVGRDVVSTLRTGCPPLVRL